MDEKFPTQTINLILNLHSSSLQVSDVISKLNFQANVSVNCCCKTCGDTLEIRIHTTEEVVENETLLFKIEPRFEEDAIKEESNDEDLITCDNAEPKSPYEATDKGHSKDDRKKFKKSDALEIYKAFSKEMGEDVAGLYQTWHKEIKTSPYYELKTLQNGTNLHLYKPARYTIPYLSLDDLRGTSCDLCGYTVKNFNGLIQHYIFHFFEDDDDTCMRCGRAFKQRIWRLRHALICTARSAVKDFACKCCRKSFQSFQQMKAHEARTATGKKICHLCSKSVTDGARLRTHLRKVHNLDPFRCEHCPKVFGSITAVRDHLIRRHFPQLAPATCTTCGHSFPTMALLRAHTATHSSTFLCDICRKTFASKGNLTAHQKTQHRQANERPHFDCDVCGKTFFSKTLLSTHKTIHLPDNEKFKCGCGKLFGLKAKRDTCERNHRNPALCKTCGKTFSDTAYLKQHMTLHTNEKPYKCQICSKQIRDRGNFRAHLKQHEATMGIKLTLTREESRLKRQRVNE